MRLLLATLALTASAASPLARTSTGEFDVSLWSSHVDLSPDYQRAIREATERYRGDFPSSRIIVRTFFVGAGSSGQRIEVLLPPPGLAGADDPFPAEPFTLDGTLPQPDAHEPTLSLQLPNT